MSKRRQKATVQEVPAAPRVEEFQEVKASIVERSALLRAVRERVVLSGMQQAERRGQILDFYLNGTPAAQLLSITAIQSESAAQNLYMLQEQQYWDALDEMVRKDPTIAGTIRLIASQISEREMTFIPRDPNDEPAKMWADEISKIMDPLLPYATDVFVTGAIRHGYSVVEIMWEQKGFKWQPKALVHQHPGTFTFDYAGKMFLYGPNAVNGMHDQSVPRWKFARMTFPGLYGNPFGDCPLDKISLLYYVKKEAMKAWADYTYRFGLPLPKCSIDESNQDAYQLKQNQLQQQLENLAVSSGIILPKGVTMDFDDRKGGSANAPHQPLIDYCNREIVKYLYGSTLAIQEAEFGTRAQAEVHASTGNQRAKSTAEFFRSAVQQIVDYWLEINYGAAAIGRVQFDIDTDDQKDLEEAIKAIEMAQKLGLPMSEQQVRDWLNLVKPEGDDAIVPPPPVTNQTPEEAAGVLPFAEAGEAEFDLSRRNRTALQDVQQNDKALMNIADALQAGSSAEMVNQAIAGEDIEVTPDIQHGLEASALIALAAGLSRLETVSRPAAMFAEYQGREVELDKPFRTPDGPKKYAVYVKNEKGNVIRLPFGDPDSEIKRDDPERRKNFRARHNCDDPGPKWKARYWSCRLWSTESVTDILNASEGCGCGCGDRVVSFAEISDIDPVFRPAVEWMAARQVVTQAQLEALINILKQAEQTPLILVAAKEQFETIARQRAFALKEAVSIQQAKAIQRATIEAVNRGTTLSDFLNTTEGDQFIRGQFGDAYTENVFRTETSNAYSAQQQAFENAPVVSAQLWGWRVMNPDDDRSRPGHKALDGKLFKQGSAASNALGRPPFSYQCRCVMVPITNREAEREGYVETADAMTLANQVERF